MPSTYKADTSTTWPTIGYADATEFKVTGGDSTSYSWALSKDGAALAQYAQAGGTSYSLTSAQWKDIVKNNGAGIYTLTISDGLSEHSISIKAPVYIDPIFTVKTLNSDAAADPLSLVGADPSALTPVTWSFVDEGGSAITQTKAETAFGAMTAYSSITSSMTSFDPLNTMDTIQRFRIKASIACATLEKYGLNTATSGVYTVVPVITPQGFVRDTFGTAVTTATLTLVPAIIESGAYTALATSGTGAYSGTQLQNTGILYKFNIGAPGFISTLVQISTTQPQDFTMTAVSTATHYTIAGRVTDKISGGLASAKITAKDSSGTILSDTDNTTFSTLTDAAGNYTLAVLQAGSVPPFKITAQKEGYITDESTATADAAPYTANLTLYQATRIIAYGVPDDPANPAGVHVHVEASPAFVGNKYGATGELRIAVKDGANDPGTVNAIGTTYSVVTATYDSFTWTITAETGGDWDISTDTKLNSSISFTYAKGTGVTGYGLKTADNVNVVAGTTLISQNNKATVNIPAGGLTSDELTKVFLAVNEVKPLTNVVAFVADIIEVDLTSASGADVSSDDIAKIYITITGFDTTTVPEGGFACGGGYVILTADTAADLMAGTYTVLDCTQIVSVDYTAGSITFWVDHLSALSAAAAQAAAAAAGTTLTDGGGACFIATAAYGSVFEKHVTILRKFRDAYLLPTRLGHKFVDAYYSISPPLADFIAGHDSLRAAVRVALLPAVGISYAMLRWGAFWTLMVMAGFMIAVVVVVRRRRGRIS